MLHLIWLLLAIVASAVANTETYLVRIPNYYDVPKHDQKYLKNRLVQVNSTTFVLEEFPILDVHNYNLTNTLVELPYDYVTKPDQKLLVKLNNYLGLTFDSNDLINVKLCWPATYPFGFDLSHEFIKSSTLLEDNAQSLDIYIVVDIKPDFYAVRPVEQQTVQFSLVISKLPNSVPIPIELYDYIIYVVDLCIVTWTLFPYLAYAIDQLVS